MGLFTVFSAFEGHFVNLLRRESIAQAEEFSHGRYCRGGGVLFHAAAIAAAAGVAVGHDGDVSDFACHAHAAAHDSAIVNNAAADAGAEREQNEVFDVAAGSDPLFAEGGGVGIVFQNDRGIEAAREFLANGEVFKRGEVVGVADHSVLKRNKAGDGDSDPRQGTGGATRAQGVYGFHHVMHNGLAPLRVSGLARDAVEHFPGPVHYRGPQIGTAQIQTDCVLRHSAPDDSTRRD